MGRTARKVKGRMGKEGQQGRTDKDSSRAGQTWD